VKLLDYNQHWESLEADPNPFVEEVGKMPYITSVERYGRRSEALSITLRLLRHKLGPLSPELEQQLEALPIERLEDLSEALLDFSEIDQLHAWLKNLS
jgi:hypothetical protein